MIYRTCTVVCGILASAPLALGGEQAESAAASGKPERWMSSRVVGSPDPPLPYTTERVFTFYEWKGPIHIISEPGTDFLWVTETSVDGGTPARIRRIRDGQTEGEPEILLEVPSRLVYGLAFHPDYATNRHLFVFSNGPREADKRLNRISRYKARTSPDSPTLVDEHVIIEWPSAGHDGGDLVFGHDGMLYITSGDGTGDSDTDLTGQDIRDLAGGVLRIDVDHPDGKGTYTIPADNPFLMTPGARGELWAFGLRNPWRMCIDKRSGQIWVGNNGQDLWESAHLLERGANYGWSVFEGSHPFYANRPLGPAPFTPPTIEHHHIEARSLTGGAVYYGSRHPELEGAYIYGDYSTGKIWGVRHDGQQVAWHKELADTPLALADFEVGPAGDIYIVDNAGGLYRLIPNPPREDINPFPTRLSETGLFTSVPEHVVAPGVIPYLVNVPGWADGAEADRFLAIPGDGKIGFTYGGAWDLPDGAVLMQTIRYPLVSDHPQSGRRIETRLLTRQLGEWNAYSYRWNEEQTEATLVGPSGDEIELKCPPSHMEVGIQQSSSWRIPSRAECSSCHARAASYLLGITKLQLNRAGPHDPAENQIRLFERWGLFKESLLLPPEDMDRLTNPYDTGRDTESRVRSYLHTNCACCHVMSGGGNARMELSYATTQEKMNLVSSRPQHDTFGIDNAMIVAPGQPQRSILYQRISRRGRGQMPPLVTQVVDAQAVQLFRNWIEGMKDNQQIVRDWQLAELIPHLSELAHRSVAAGKTAYDRVGCGECHRLRKSGGGVGPDLTDIGSRLQPAEFLQALVEPSQKIASEYATTVIHTSDGRTVEGRVEREDETVVVLRSPASFAVPVTIHKVDIEERQLSSVSMMPKGILNTLEIEQILDLAAYVLSPEPEKDSGGQ